MNPTEYRLGWVVDASVISKWFLRDEEAVDRADRILDAYIAGSGPVAAPRYAHYELTSTLLRAVRNGRLSQEAGERAVARFARLRIAQRHDPDERIARALELAYGMGLSFYDGVYLALAEELGMPFVTADVVLYERTMRFLPIVALLTDLSL